MPQFNGPTSSLASNHPIAAAARATRFSDWQLMRSLKTADSDTGGTPASLLAAALADAANQVVLWDVPEGANYLDLMAVATAAITVGAVVECYGRDAGSHLRPLLSETGERQITFGPETVALAADQLVAEEASLDDHLVYCRGLRQVLVFIRTAGVSGGDLTLYGRPLF